MSHGGWPDIMIAHVTGILDRKSPVLAVIDVGGIYGGVRAYAGRRGAPQRL